LDIGPHSSYSIYCIGLLKLECGRMPNVMAALPNIDGALCSTPESLADSTRVPCSNNAKTRKPLKFDGVPQTNETISSASGPKFTRLCGQVEEILLLKNFFPIVDKCLSCEDSGRQSCATVRRWRLIMAAICNRGAIIFLPCSFLMVALCNRADHYIFAL